MAGITFSLGSSDFGALDGTTNGRFALDIEVDRAEQWIRRHHIPGVDGNIVIRGGQQGRDIKARVRYRGESVTACLTLYEDDRQAWQNEAIAIMDDNGTTYDTCNLVRIIKLSPLRATGRADNQTQFDIEYTFIQDGATETES